jgi:tetratricopeptide (TPR) repeat protein
MFNFEFDDYDEFRDEDRLRELVDSFEAGDRAGYLDSDALDDIASWYYDKGRFEDALCVVDRVLASHPFSSDAWMRKGILLNNLDRHTDALDAYERALALNPADVETLVNRGITLDTLDRPKDALDSYRQALSLDPVNDEALFNIGVTMERLNQPAEAVSVFGAARS